MNHEQFTSWRKSTRSEPDSNCVEVAPGSLGNVGVRDSKDVAGPHLAFTPTQWAGFLTTAKSGRFDIARR